MSSPLLKPHALEMLRLIGAVCSRADGDGGGYWHPQDKSQSATDEGGTFTVFVDGGASTGAIRTLTTRGLVETIPSLEPMGASKWARRITPAGREVLDVHLRPIIEAYRAQRAVWAEEARRERAGSGWPDVEDDDDL